MLARKAIFLSSNLTERDPAPLHKIEKQLRMILTLKLDPLVAHASMCMCPHTCVPTYRETYIHMYAYRINTQNEKYKNEKPR